MTKAELVDHVAATVQLSKAQTDAVLTQCLQALSPPCRREGRFARLWPVPRAPPPAADRPQPPHGRDSPDSGQSGPDLTAGKAFQDRVQSSAPPA